MEKSELKSLIKEAVREEIVYAVKEYLDAKENARQNFKAKVEYEDLRRASKPIPAQAKEV